MVFVVCRKCELPGVKKSTAGEYLPKKFQIFHRAASENNKLDDDNDGNI